MTSKASRRSRAKRAKVISMPGGDDVPAPMVTGQHKPKDDPMAVVIAARMRQTGITDPAEARQPICGDHMGLCIRALATGDDRAELVNTWAAISASHRNFRTLVLGTTGSPQGAAIPMLAEPMETDQSLRVDLRTHDERVEAAKRGWGAWEAKIAALPAPNLRWALSGALDGFLGDGALWRDRAPTDTGRVAVMALRMIGKA
jgi:hypothetical protein